ncbi:hypothetical protein OQA88_12636 [Cercophora sp. LCS_1]
MDLFKVRLNCIDHYQAKPTRYDPRLRNDVRASQVAREPQVPVIRVFGSTETGQKVCAHIHGAFPYLYVEYRGPLDRRTGRIPSPCAGHTLMRTVGEYMCRLHSSVDRALGISYRRDTNRESPRFVARITLVKGVPFYGFHVGYRFYLKIYMLNPLVMTRLADLLQQGLIMGQKFQPYEAHLSFLLQFMVDYNLYGCDYINSERVVFRAPVPQHDFSEDAPRTWDDETIPPERITDDPSLPRASHCSVEVDICVKDILNRKEVKARPLHHGFVEKDHPLPSDLKLVHSMAGLWKDETKRRKRRTGILSPDSSVLPSEVLVSMSADTRRADLPGWVHEEGYREEIKNLISEEKEVSFSFEDYVPPVPHEERVKTVLDSVEDLFPENLLPALGLEESFLEGHPEAVDQVDLDENGILELEVGQEAKQLFPDDPNQDATDERKSEDPTTKGWEMPEKYTINRLRAGAEVFVSGQRTGKRPELPFPEELLAEAQRLVTGDRNATAQSHQVSLKRPRPVVVEAISVKRPKLDEPKAELTVLTGTQEPTASSGGSGKVNATKTRSSQPSRPGSRRKPSGNQPLNFPVVKDAQNMSPRLRLSQRSNSQPSQESPLKRVVTFDPLVPTKETLTASPSPKTPSAKSPLTPSLGRPSLDPKSPTVPPAKLRWKGATTMWLVNAAPPLAEEVRSTMQDYGVPDQIHQDAFYSKDGDVPTRLREFAGKEFRIEGGGLLHLPDFDPDGASTATYGVKPEAPPDFDGIELAYRKKQKQCTIRRWDVAAPPPTFDEVNAWWAKKQKRKTATASQLSQATPTQKPYLSQVIGPTPKSKHGFKYSQKRKSTSVRHEAQYMSSMSLEVHVNTRGKLVPNPEEDEVQCVFWCLKSDEDSLLSSSQSNDKTVSGVVVLSEDGSLARRIRSQTADQVDEETSELDVMIRMVEIVRSYDPDILTGYEVHGGSWGYLIERARAKYDYNLSEEFSRTKSDSHGKSGKEADRWGFNTTSSIKVTGRHMINIWRAMRGELNLLQYTMENVVWHLLHRRVPHYSWRTLTDWYVDGGTSGLSKVLRHYRAKTRLDIEILEANELVPRTSEQARLLGVDFFSVFSRGSQFKVESIMFRIAKPENFVLVSPSKKQVGAQNALECLPLVMEPQSAFYSSPLLVLDFQSLYPSVMVAYNYCYSTFLGRIVNWRGSNKMGFTEYRRREGLLNLLKDYVNVAPNGVMYTKPEIRKSLLAKMLTEILETRVMVKSGMKQDKDDKTLQQLLNNRQLALKLLANVTYGYTSASFSGRMPCSEIADSIVQTGRETLERAIAFIHSVERWNAEVVYGDTDSLFVHLKGRTRAQAFEIGNEIAKEITNMNPRPVKLKFEKVYHPCVLLAKKRYVGYKYESADQAAPEFDAKGIETVRRDGTPAEQKMEEKALRILFETADLSQVKAYFQDQCARILRGAVSIQDFCFAREVKLGTYSNKGVMPAGAMISAKRMLEDARAEPQYGERVPYVVIAGGPGARLIDRCVAPEDLLNSSHATLDAEYYIGKNIIPPLERIFNLVGANVRGWYAEMPKVQQVRKVQAPGGGLFGGAGQKTLEWFMQSTSCLVCGVKMKGRRPEGRERPICRRCESDKEASMIQLQTRLNGEERSLNDVVKVCQSCAGMAPLEEVPCDSKDCPVFYTRTKQSTRLRAEKGVIEPVLRTLVQELDW